MLQTIIEGSAYVLGDNVDTDQIIPAHYLTYNPSIPSEYRMFGKFALSGVPEEGAGLPKGHVPFHSATDEFISPYKIMPFIHLRQLWASREFEMQNPPVP